MGDTRRGRVKWFSAQKGFGFIERDDGSKDVFLHASKLPEGYVPKEGERVAFEVVETKRGPQAEKVLPEADPTRTTKARKKQKADRDDSLEPFLPLPKDLRQIIAQMTERGAGRLGLKEGLDSPTLALDRGLFFLHRDSLNPDESADGHSDRRKKLKNKFLVQAAVSSNVTRALESGESGSARSAAAFAPVRPLLESWLLRRDRVLGGYRERGFGHIRLTASVAWRTVTGLGESNPWETGITLHPILGVPILRSSALRGVCRRGALEQGKADDAIAEALGSPSRAGQVRFLEGLPKPDTVRLEVDVMTPHLGPYYTQQGMPRESDLSPNPVTFLVAGRDTTFVVDLLAPSDADNALSEAAKWLDTGLKALGIGAKTAVGYGWLKVEQSASRS